MKITSWSLTGLKAGDEVCLTRFAQMGEGAKIKVVAP